MILSDDFSMTFRWFSGSSEFDRRRVQSKFSLSEFISIPESNKVQSNKFHLNEFDLNMIQMWSECDPTEFDLDELPIGNSRIAAD